MKLRVEAGVLIADRFSRYLMQNHFEYRKRVSYTFLIHICLKLWVGDLHQLITKGCDMYVHTEFYS